MGAFLGNFDNFLGNIFCQEIKIIPILYGPERVDKAENCISGGILVIFWGNFDNFWGNIPPNFHGRGMGVNIFCQEKKITPLI